MRISRAEAEPYFAHKSQRIMGLEELPDEPFEYLAFGNVCGAFHDSFWPGVAMVHVGMKPEGLGRSDAHAMAILHWYAEDRECERITAWIDQRNRAAMAFARRLGFEDDGEMKMASETVKMMGWSA